jgi:hypothetical protein
MVRAPKTCLFHDGGGRDAKPETPVVVAAFMTRRSSEMVPSRITMTIIRNNTFGARPLSPRCTGQIGSAMAAIPVACAQDHNDKANRNDDGQ